MESLKYGYQEPTAFQATALRQASAVPPVTYHSIDELGSSLSMVPIRARVRVKARVKVT